MAEYYPLLAKAIGSLPNSTPDSRRVVYERARKALIGQLRTMHPPVPDEDIERESVALDRAVERLESELASGSFIAGTPAASAKASEPSGTAPPSPTVPTPPPSARMAVPSPPKLSEPKASEPKASDLKPAEAKSTELKPPSLKPPVPQAPAPKPPALKPPGPKPASPDALPPAGGVPATPKPPQLRTPTTRPPANAPTVPGLALKPPVLKPSAGKADHGEQAADETPSVRPPAEHEGASAELAKAEPLAPPPRADESKRLKPPQRPIAPQPPGAQEPKRRLWIIPVGLGVVIALVALAAWKLRDRPETLARTKPVEHTQADSGKISERVGEPSRGVTIEPPSQTKEEAPKVEAPKESPKPAEETAEKSAPPVEQPAPSNNANPALPVAHRAALLVEAPDEPNKVKTFLGTVVWKLDNAPQGANAAVGLAVEADIDLPDDKMKATVIFEKNADSSLPASHTVKVRFAMDPGSFSGNVKQISVPQMRPEASPGGETLAGVTVPITTNAFLVGLSPGNAEAANTDLLRRLSWIDIPIMLDNGKIAKLTFEKGASGERDLNEALQAWQKQQ